MRMGKGFLALVTLLAYLLVLIMAQSYASNSNPSTRRQRVVHKTQTVSTAKLTRLTQLKTKKKKNRKPQFQSLRQAKTQKQPPRSPQKTVQAPRTHRSSKTKLTKAKRTRRSGNYLLSKHSTVPAPSQRLPQVHSNTNTSTATLNTRETPSFILTKPLKHESASWSLWAWATEKPTPQLGINSLFRDVGALAPGAIAKHDLVLTNTGAAPLRSEERRVGKDGGARRREMAE